MAYGIIIRMFFFDTDQRLVLAWIEIHREELIADWALAVQGESVFRIEPLR